MSASFVHLVPLSLILCGVAQFDTMWGSQPIGRVMISCHPQSVYSWSYFLFLDSTVVAAAGCTNPQTESVFMQLSARVGHAVSDFTGSLFIVETDQFAVISSGGRTHPCLLQGLLCYSERHLEWIFCRCSYLASVWRSVFLAELSWHRSHQFIYKWDQLHDVTLRYFDSLFLLSMTTSFAASS